MIERKADVAPRHRQALHGIEAGGIFGPWRAKELPPGRNLVEQTFDPDPRARWKRGGTFLDPRPVSCVERVLDQSLERARRSLDHLAGGDAIDELGRQPSY